MLRSIKTVLVGVRDPKMQAAIRHVMPSTAATLVHEPDNAFDPNAIAVRVNGVRVGYLWANIAEKIVASSYHVTLTWKPGEKKNEWFADLFLEPKV
jgi:hypothetical protein